MLNVNAGEVSGFWRERTQSHNTGDRGFKQTRTTRTVKPGLGNVMKQDVQKQKASRNRVREQGVVV